MEKTIQIDGKEVKFKANGNTPRLYRTVFHRDIFADISKLSDAIKIVTDKNQKSDDPNSFSFLDVASLEVFENVAYIMAKQGDSSIPNTIDEWLDSFDTFSIYLILPEIIELWNLNNIQISESKKNIETLTGK